MGNRAYKAEWARKAYAADPEKYREAARRWRERNPKPKTPKTVRTHCKHGHELSTENTYMYTDSNGKIVIECKPCAKRKYKSRASQLRANHLQRKFGISLEQYDQMLAEQDGKCAVCGTTDPGGNGGSNFHVDHCHITGKIRKLLCRDCNSCLGQAGDDPVLLRKLAGYVEEHQVCSDQ